MIFDKKILKAEFIERPNRFNAKVILNDEEITVHVPNTGRCREILIKGSTVLLRKEDNPNRKTKYDLIAAYKNKKLINIDSQIPNKVVKEALVDKNVDNLVDYSTILCEKTIFSSRFDFKLIDEDENEYYLEVKGVTLEEDGYCSFPDAPTERGARHLMELIEVKKTGRGAGVLFLIQMDNVKEFTPNYETDPKFCEALKKAYDNNVDIMAYSCKITENELTLDKKVKINLR